MSVVSGLSLLFMLEQEYVQSRKDMEKLSKEMKELLDRVESLIFVLTTLVRASNFDTGQFASLFKELNGDLKKMDELCKESMENSFKQIYQCLGLVEECAVSEGRHDLAVMLATQFDDSDHQNALKKHEEKFRSFLECIVKIHELMQAIASAISDKRSVCALEQIFQSLLQIEVAAKELQKLSK